MDILEEKIKRKTKNNSPNQFSTEDKDVPELNNRRKKRIKQFFNKIWKWSTSTKERITSLIFLIVFIILMVILGILGKGPTTLMLNIVYWFENKTGTIGLYIATAIVSFIGNLVVFLPTVYTIILMFVALLDVNIFILGISAGIGAAIGQIISWFIGRATREIIDEKTINRLKRAKSWIEKGLAPLIIYLFASTPLPDEVLLIMIGLLNYSLWKTMISCFLGKITLTLACSLLAKYLSTTNFGVWLLNALFNLTPEMLINGEIPASENVWTTVAIWLITLLLLVFGGLFDWGEIADRRKCKREGNLLKELMYIISKNEDKIDYSFLKLKKFNEIVDFLPENSLWFFEENIVKKKKIFARKSILSISAITNSYIELTSSRNWAKKLNQAILNNPEIIQNKKELTLIGYPHDALEKGILFNKIKLLSFKTKLTNVFNNKLTADILNSSNLKFRIKRGLKKTRLKVEFLIEELINKTIKVWAIGLREGIHLKNINSLEFPSYKLLIYWGVLLNLPVSEFSNISDFTLYEIAVGETKNQELNHDAKIKTECPI